MHKACPFPQHAEHYPARRRVQEALPHVHTQCKRHSGTGRCMWTVVALACSSRSPGSPCPPNSRGTCPPRPGIFSVAPLSMPARMCTPARIQDLQQILQLGQTALATVCPAPGTLHGCCDECPRLKRQGSALQPEGMAMELISSTACIGCMAVGQQGCRPAGMSTSTPPFRLVFTRVPLTASMKGILQHEGVILSTAHISVVYTISVQKCASLRKVSSTVCLGYTPCWPCALQQEAHASHTTTAHKARLGHHLQSR